MIRLTHTYSCLFAIGLLSLVGCQQDRQTASSDQPPSEQPLRIVYEVAHPYRALRSTTSLQLASASVLDVATELAEPTPEHPWTRAKLTIEYPHPEGLPGVARASLLLGRESGIASAALGNSMEKPPVLAPWLTGIETGQSESGLDDEIWVLDLPLSQVQTLIAGLGESGYFEEQTRPGNGVQLQVKMGESQYKKPWNVETSLEQIVARVHQEGWLNCIHSEE